jgi:hypothetical protein
VKTNKSPTEATMSYLGIKKKKEGLRVLQRENLKVMSPLRRYAVPGYEPFSNSLNFN